MIRRIAFAAFIAAAATPLGAQISRGRGGFVAAPNYWVGLSYGYVDGITLNDGHSNSTWAFQYASQLRATLEKTVGQGVTVGASAGFSNPRLDYVGRGLGDPCGGLGCQADADVTQYMAFLRSGGGIGFHGLFSFEAGVTQFSKFRDRTTGNDLTTANSSTDFTFGLGGGFGYGVSTNTDLYLGEQWDIVLHHQGDVDGGTTRAPRVAVFRVGARVGF